MITKSDYQAKLNKTKKILFGANDKDGIIFKIIVYALLTILGFIFLYPLIGMITMSFKSIDDLLNSSIRFIPSQIYWSNYQTALTVMGLPTSLSDLFRLNNLYKTIILIGGTSIISTISSCLIGYGFARFDFPFKKGWLIIVVITFIIPSQIILLPQLIWFNSVLKISGTVFSYFIPALFGQGLNTAVFILIFYVFFSMIPKSLDEAAYIDGANEFQVFYNVGLKLSLQPIIVVFLFGFVWYWNDFYRASYLLAGSTWTTLPVELANFETQFKIMADNELVQTKNLYEPLIMAGTVLTILPLLIIYFFMQKHFVESVDRTGITGE